MDGSKNISDSWRNISITVDNHLVKLRQKLERDPSDPVHFKTVHSFGYKFVR